MVQKINSKQYSNWQLAIGNWQLKIFISFVVILISSCKVGKEYQRPALELPNQFNNAVSFADTSSIADIEWKKFFTDTTLQNLINKGVTYNHDLLLAIKR